MNITCSANKGVLPVSDCLNCALTGDAPCGYDYSILRSMYAKNDDRRNEIHVTDITGCLRKAFYSKKLDIPESPHQMLVRHLGTQFHASVENNDEHMQSEIPLSMEGIVGRSDIIYKDGRLVDLKCQPAGEMVTMADGSEKKIEDIQIFDRVLAWDGEKLVASEVTSIMDGGEQEVLEITIASGQVIRVSAGHPVLTDRGFVRADALIACEDRVVSVKDWIGDNEIPLDDARLVGYLTGDGGTSKLYGVAFSNQDKEVIDDLTRICNSKGWDVRKRSEEDRYDYSITMRGKKLSTVGPKAFIQKYGLHGKLAYEKTIPDCIMSGSRDVVANFIAGYFDTDGTITNDKTSERIPARLSITTTSKELARQTSELLRRLGIANRIHENLVGYGGRITRMAYTICVWQADMILKFGEVVPFLNKKKRDRLNGWKPILEAVLRKGGKNTRRVDKIVSLGTMRTIGLEIANTHTYVTNGVITHNTSRWLIPSKLPYGSHELQVNIYAYILKQSGMEINRLQIQYVDMSGPTKHRSCGVAVVNINGELRCPKCGEFVKNAHLGAVLIDVPFYPEEVIKEYIETRVKSLQASLDANFEPEREPSFLCDYCPAFEICKPGENQ